MSARTDLAAAAGSVPGVTGRPYPPDVITAGDAWPVWVETAWLNYCGALSTYDVYIAIPGPDLSSTIDTGDELLGQLLLAFGDLDRAEVVSAEPAAVIGEGAGAAVPCLKIRCAISHDM